MVEVGRGCCRVRGSRRARFAAGCVSIEGPLVVIEEEEDVLGFVRLSSSWWNLRFEVSSATGMMVVVHLSDGRAVVREMFFRES